MGKEDIKKELVPSRNKLTVAYARVSSYDQKEDLNKQKQVLSSLNPDVLISDIGSGLNFNKSGFNKLLNLILHHQIKEILITHKDRLIRFGFPLIEKLCLHFNVKITVIYEEKQVFFEQNLINDLISIITVFSSKIYGKRSHKNKNKIKKE